MATTNMSLTQSSVGVTSGPDWATNTETNWGLIDTHDHSSGKGVQITPAGININADLEFNANDATELRTVAFDSSADATTTADRRCIYESSGDIYWRNASGTAVQITSGTAVGSGVGSIDGMGSTDAEVQYNDTSGQKSFSFIHDKSTSPKSVAKMAFSDFSVYNFSNYNDLVTVKYTGSGAAGVLTLPDETGTFVTSASTVSDISVTSTTTLKPILTLANNTNDATAPTISFKNLRDSNNGVNGDDAGTINFYANDAAGNNQIFSQILAEISDATSGGEEGKISISVAEYDGTVTPGFILTGASTDGIVDATIGAGATSTTTIAGTLDLGDRAILNVGDIDCDSISVADAANGLEVNFNGNTGTNKISLTDNLGSALDITEASNSYIKFVTSDSAEKVELNQNTTLASGKTLDVSAGTLTTSTAQKQAIAYLAFASTTAMIFHQSAAPTGWTKVSTTGTGSASVNDVALRVVTGDITDGTGGSVAFDTAFASHTPNITANNASVTLAEAAIPNHTHDINTTTDANLGRYSGGYIKGYQYGDGGAMRAEGGTGSVGGGGHTHTNTPANDAINLDVSYVDVIIATKD